MAYIINCDSDDEVRFTAIIRHSLNRVWANNLNTPIDDRAFYAQRAYTLKQVVDMHQNKDRHFGDNGGYATTADIRDVEEI